MADFRVEDHTDDFIEESSRLIEKALTTIGLKTEKYAKALCPVGKGEWIDGKTGRKHKTKGYRGGTLRNSISFGVGMTDAEGVLGVGSNVEYAPYVELGTGPNFTPPPEWEHFESKKGSGMPGRAYVKARPFLRPAIEDHLSEFKDILEKTLID